MKTEWDGFNRKYDSSIKGSPMKTEDPQLKLTYVGFLVKKCTYSKRFHFYTKLGRCLLFFFFQNESKLNKIL